MARFQDTLAHFRPRITVRGLLFMIAWVSLYLAAWRLTISATENIEAKLGRPVVVVPCPFVVSVFEPIPTEPPPDSFIARIKPEYWKAAGIGWEPQPTSRYYFWFFGYLRPTSHVQRRRDYMYRDGRFIPMYKGPPIVIEETTDEPPLGTQRPIPLS